MRRSDIVLEFALGLVTLWATWYAYGTHPAPVPAFWYHTGVVARRVQSHAYTKYLASIGENA